MKTIDIQSELQMLFAEQDAASGGTIVVWHDPDSEFSESIEDLDLPDIEVVRESEQGRLALKRKLNENLDGQCILIYRERARRLDGDWLADVEARAGQFAADYASVQLRELGAPDTSEMRSVLQAHRRFLSKRTVMKKLARLSSAYETPGQLEGAIVAVALGAPAADAATVLRTYLTKAHETSCREAFEPLEQAACVDSFRSAVAAWTGFAGDITDFEALAQHIMLSALCPHVPPEVLDRFKRCYAPEGAPFCHTLLNAWSHDPQHDDLFDICLRVETATGIESTFEGAEASALVSADVLPCIDAVLLRKLFHTVAAGFDDVDDVLDTIGKRRSTTWYARFSCYYDGIEAAARMQRFYRDNAGNFAAGTPANVWRRYTSEFYLMDYWYRKLHAAFLQAMRESAYGLDEDFRACNAAIEDIYTGWYLKELTRWWITAGESQLEENGAVNGVPRQLDFAMAEVSPIVHNKKRAWVIVSDALRYEVAAELSERLERETKGTCELDAVQAAFPSVTKVGMGALLPSTSFSLVENDGAGKRPVSVLVDGGEANGTAARDQVIRQHYPTGIAVRFDDFFNKLGRAERRERVGDAEVVYIYHNTIDAIGDKPETEHKVFTACTEAIEEIAACVQLVVREFGAAHVVVTADHGFLYTDSPLAESDHAAVADVDGEIIETGRRYVIAREGSSSEPLVNVALPSVGSRGTSLTGFSPRGNVRIRTAGRGENYVHGGISLQELCVPVLRFTNRRAGSKGYVASAPSGITLVSQIDIISNTLFTLEFLQDEPVGGKILPAEYEVFVGDAAHTPVTDIARLVADRTDEDAANRRMRISLSLKPGIGTSEHELYHLYARNTGTGDMLTLHDLRIRVSFAPTIDFGW